MLLVELAYELFEVLFGFFASWLTDLVMGLV